MAEGLVPIEFEGDPERCQNNNGTVQCRYKAIPGKNVCRIHVASSARVEEVQSTRNYRIAKYQMRLEEFADNPQMKSLREEIGLLRIVLEEVWNSCNGDSNKVIASSNKIADLVTRVEKLVKSCHHLEKSTGALLDKAAAQQMMGRVLSIITEHIEDTEIIGKIADEIVKAIKDAQPTAAE